jgi:hypothetical protein
VTGLSRVISTDGTERVTIGANFLRKVCWNLAGKHSTIKIPVVDVVQIGQAPAVRDIKSKVRFALIPIHVYFIHESVPFFRCRATEHALSAVHHDWFAMDREKSGLSMNRPIPCEVLGLVCSGCSDKEIVKNSVYRATQCGIMLR